MSGLSAVGGAIISGGNVDTTVAGVGGGLVGNVIYDHFFPDGPLGKDKNPLNPENQKQVNKIFRKEGNASKTVTPNLSSQQQAQNAINKNIRYDDMTDFNKVATGIIKDGIIGGLGAITGMLTGGNIAIDTTTGGLTALTQKAPQLEKPKSNP